MLEQAKKKINDEMEKESNSYVKVIGKFLLEHLESDPAAAEKIMDEDKTIMGSLKRMEKEAKEHKVGNVGVITPEQGFIIVLEYYGIKSVIREKKKNVDFDVELDDLL